MTTIEQLWEHFLFHQRVQRHAPGTMSFYAVSRDKLNIYLEERKLPHEVPGITVTHLRGFVEWLGERGLQPGGQHAHVRAIKALFNWCYREELIEVNPAKRLALPPLPKRRLPTVAYDHTQQLLNAAKKTDQPLRDTAILMVLFDTGLRVSELVGIKLADFHPERGVIHICAGKGGKDRIVPVGTRTLTALGSYQRRERRPRWPHTDNLFLSHRGEPLTRSGIGIRLAALAKGAGLPRSAAAPHAFRRGFAVEFLRNGGDVFTLQQILGHSSLEMTRRYVNFLDDDLKAAHLRFSPIDRLTPHR